MSKELTPKIALEILTKAFKEDPAYAFTWHSNISMMCQDAITDYTAKLDIEGDRDAINISNDAASRFMKICFGVETSQDMLVNPCNQ